MPLENMKAMLSKAAAGKYAVGAFNILDYNSTKAVVQAAQELRAPVIIQTSAKTVTFWGSRTLMGWMRELAASTSVPVAVHLDHCKDLALIKECIEAGWTSVMIDASARPFEENLSLSRQVVEMARPRDVTVEAELGAIVGVEDDIHVKEQDSHLADPAQAVEFCAQGPAGLLRPCHRHRARHLQGRAEDRLSHPRKSRGDHARAHRPARRHGPVR